MSVLKVTKVLSNDRRHAYFSQVASSCFGTACAAMAVHQI